MKRKFAIMIAFLLVTLLAATLVACDIDDGKTPNGITLREDMTWGELVDVAREVKSATVKAYDESNQLIYEKYYSENACICYFYGDKDLYSSLDMYDTQGWILDGSLLYQFYKDGNDTKMTVVDYDGYDYNFLSISCAESILECISGGNSTIENNTIVFTTVFLGYTTIPTIVYSNLNSTEFALPKEFANCKEEAETRPMVEFVATPLEDDNTKCKITKINCNDNFGLLKSINIVIPKNLDGKPVTEIGDGAFSGCSGLTSITIPDGVTNIGNSAFSGCSGLTSITIPNSVTSIGKYAFSGCEGLTSVTIPDSVTNIGDSAFSACRSLTSITIPDSVTNIGDHAFSGCRGLTSVTIGNSVISIGWGAFWKCAKLTTVNWNATACTRVQLVFEDCFRLTELNIGDNVTTIPAYAFRDCFGLTSVTIPNSVTSIGEYAFWGCRKLVEVYNKSSLDMEANNLRNYGLDYILNVYTEEGGSKLSVDKDGYEIYTDEGTKSLVAYHGTETDIVLPSDITAINQYAFYNCDELTSIVIPDKVTSINDAAFSFCIRLSSVIIGNGVTNIGNYAFERCFELKMIYYNGTVEEFDKISIGTNAFILINAKSVICTNGTVDKYFNDNIGD